MMSDDCRYEPVIYLTLPALLCPLGSCGITDSKDRFGWRHGISRHRNVILPAGTKSASDRAVFPRSHFFIIAASSSGSPCANYADLQSDRDGVGELALMKNVV